MFRRVGAGILQTRGRVVHLHRTHRNDRESLIRFLGVLRALAVKNVSSNRGDAKDAKGGRGNTRYIERAGTTGVR